MKLIQILADIICNTLLDPMPWTEPADKKGLLPVTAENFLTGLW